MTARQLLARLSNTDPDFLVVIDTASKSVTIVNPRPGFCLPGEIEEDERRYKADQDQAFLRDLDTANGEQTAPGCECG
jgi:hypothetical protein